MTNPEVMWPGSLEIWGGKEVHKGAWNLCPTRNQGARVCWANMGRRTWRKRRWTETQPPSVLKPWLQTDIKATASTGTTLISHPSRCQETSARWGKPISKGGARSSKRLGRESLQTWRHQPKCAGGRGWEATPHNPRGAAVETQRPTSQYRGSRRDKQSTLPPLPHPNNRNLTKSPEPIHRKRRTWKKNKKPTTPGGTSHSQLWGPWRTSSQPLQQ